MRTSALLVVLLACAAAAVADGAPCDAVSCGMGTCTELPPPHIPLLPDYKCDCYPGWGNLLAIAPSTPCYLPKCSLGGLSCYIPGIPVVPPGSNLTLHPCLGTDCGPGTCLEEPLRCQCNPGAVNLVGNPAFPCTNQDCVLDKNGCTVPNPTPSSPTPPSSAPPGNDPSSSGPTAPSTTKGSVCVQNLLLLALLATLHVVV